MKLVSIVIFLVAAVFAAKSWRDKTNPLVIEHPVYAEVRVDAKEGSREINMVLFAETVDHDDCQLRTTKTWKKVLADCPACVLSPPKCLDALPSRYTRLFDNTPIPSRYLALTRGSRYERNARMVVYGLTRDEGIAICGQLRAMVAARYTGKLVCIDPSE